MEQKYVRNKKWNWRQIWIIHAEIEWFRLRSFYMSLRSGLVVKIFAFGCKGRVFESPLGVNFTEFQSLALAETLRYFINTYTSKSSFSICTNTGAGTGCSWRIRECVRPPAATVYAPAVFHSPAISPAHICISPPTLHPLPDISTVSYLLFRGFFASEIICIVQYCIAWVIKECV